MQNTSRFTEPMESKKIFVIFSLFSLLFERGFMKFPTQFFHDSNEPKIDRLTKAFLF